MNHASSPSPVTHPTIKNRRCFNASPNATPRTRAASSASRVQCAH
ncbi:hypothetical protein G155_00149 [Mycobacterium sp. VKM Ac-1817D]|nr:hypothetical protein G155_00149 [Mycobacterium sp. VKM Ac-1817D]